MSKEIPYKIYLEESEMPKQWYNVRADMKKKPAPLLNPATKQPVTAEELEAAFLPGRQITHKFCGILNSYAVSYTHLTLPTIS